MSSVDKSAIAEFIHVSKYARHIPELERRELPLESIARVEKMHTDRFPDLKEDIAWAFDMVRQNKVLPSMRSMQFGGAAVLANNARIYNCSFSLCDRPRFFQEALFLLLSGTGVGFSVQYEHVEQLPKLGRIDNEKVVHHQIADTIEGWSDALGALIMSYLRGYYIEFSYHKIRDRGDILKTSGGRAPGHLPLKKALDKVRLVLDGAQGRQLRPIECYRIMCLAADAVLSGGIRRSAMIALFSYDDDEMMTAKTGDWFQRYPEYANSNNSVVLLRKEAKKRQFQKVIQACREWGEPGFYFTDSIDLGCNPCVEINLDPILTINDDSMDVLTAMFPGDTMPKSVKPGARFTGWSMCNLTEQNASLFATPEDFYAAARAASIIGTLQASYTSIPYLGWVTEAILRREALLGVGMTGMMDSPAVAFDPTTQRTAAKIAVDTNIEFAGRIGIRQAARVTCVKPSGTTSLRLGCVGSGIHPHPGSTALGQTRYFRRVVANTTEPTFRHFRQANPHMCEPKGNDRGDWVITFPVEVPEGAVLQDDIGAVDFLKKVISTQENWVVPGTARPWSAPGACHNVSNTVVVAEGEWESVIEFLWENRHKVTGVSLLPKMGDKMYQHAPREVVVTEADREKWDYLAAHYVPVDWASMRETEDGTNLSGEAACAGGACEVPL